ncbi:MAG: hypothetical protein SFY92_00720 [Verrucomicrobiae bacterium]|nr:hypothetical protein [Verrucomicrobiae bacterium]
MMMLVFEVRYLVIPWNGVLVGYVLTAAGFVLALVVCWLKFEQEALRPCLAPGQMDFPL